MISSNPRKGRAMLCTGMKQVQIFDMNLFDLENPIGSDSYTEVTFRLSESVLHIQEEFVMPGTWTEGMTLGSPTD